MSFDELGLHPKVLKAIAESGYTEPTKIQLKAIPKIARGFDIRASAQTGTGKTATFLLPALSRLAAPSPVKGKGPRVLILVPTRELAMQIATQAEKYSKYLNNVKTVCVVGGVPYHAQMRNLSRPYDILIATPGRLIDYIEQKKVTFPRLEMLVLDEADRMLDMGFVEPVEQIVKLTPKERQTLLFSATLQGSVIKLSERLMEKPMEIKIHAEREKNENITQGIHFADNLPHKNALLEHTLKKEGVKFAIVFTATKRHADKLVRELKDEGHKAAALHGDMNQRQRSRTVEQLRKGRVRILVATDVAARGIDVQSITHVINFDLPNNVEDYVHRIGRTGRAGAKGTAISFVASCDAYLVKKIEKFTGQKIDVLEIEGLEPRSKPDFTQQQPRKKKSFRSRPGGGGGGARRPGGAKRPKFGEKGAGKRPFRRRRTRGVPA
ncbi:MAG: ATP-dependent RNA helicase RhlE [Chlamydiales bacterium]|nr:ATP-dependent RNA helicase RhlE [Chlamydiales bacterium]MCH9619123.1 ATP-dependent RNA helicase RhlE [Chlamydiales bacterium]MCH9622385.1 ATP-dependent RNA helicase RhlE [Chlamydiales bacterium]